MIFVGDIAYHDKVRYRVDEANYIFSDDVAVGNLEGAILGDSRNPRENRVIYNAPAVIEYFQEANIKIVSLANNHITDLSLSPSVTIDILKKNNISHCGAGENIYEAAKPAKYYDNNNKIIFLAFGWEVIQCIAAKNYKPGVNPLRPEHFLRTINNIRLKEKNAKIVILVHWGYELELYPLPMHRQMAFAAVDAGADAIIGTHSHCVQGIEVYNGAPIVYSLGNWLFPQRVFKGGRTTFPDFTRLQLAFQWNLNTNDMICHWFEYIKSDDFTLKYLNSEQIYNSKRISKLTPFDGMGRQDYIAWFKRNRRKKILLPIYKEYHKSYVNSLYDLWNKLRDVMIKLFVLLRIRNIIKFKLFKTIE